VPGAIIEAKWNTGQALVSRLKGCKSGKYTISEGSHARWTDGVGKVVYDVCCFHSRYPSNVACCS